MSLQNHTPIVISADGKCVNQPDSFHSLAEQDDLQTLEIIIDGTQLLSSVKTSLLGDNPAFLSESRAYRLQEMRPLDKGRCLAIYIRD